MKFRHKVEVAVLFFLVFVSLIARTDYWVSWAVLSIFFGVLCLFDWMFLADNAFLYEPNFKNWQRICDSRY